MLVRVDERGRITLPKKFREKLKIKNDDYLMVAVKDGQLIGKAVIPIQRPKDFLPNDVKENAYTKEELLEHIKDVVSISGKHGS